MIADHVAATIAHAGDVDHGAALAPDRADDGGAHVLQVAVERAHGDDFVVGLNDGPANDGLGLVVGGGGLQVPLEHPGPFPPSIHNSEERISTQDPDWVPGHIRDGDAPHDWHLGVSVPSWSLDRRLPVRLAPPATSGFQGRWLRLPPEEGYS